MEDADAVLERICDLHDMIRDAIHATSSAHFLRSVNVRRSEGEPAAGRGGDAGDGNGGFVFVKEFGAAEAGAAVAETEQPQQQAERDAAIARLEQSHIILAMRLADYRGKKYRVIDKALSFVGHVHDLGCCVTPETLYENKITRSQSSKNLEGHEGRNSSMLIQMFVSGFAAAKNSFRLVRIHGVLRNAAVFAVSMLALMQLNQVACSGGTAHSQYQTFYKRNRRRFSWSASASSHSSQLEHLEVVSARG
ncbi:hypothetical protein MUK42_16726 [Musa troglodytarum]|uniref:Plastid division protein PDV1 n=1 Tax=Musa troglodytarum TaxID=320322 RepID=A0A9E7H8I0_9LILI|nr:hypothetical protein MUK42_16726 [Musa troglodytarum]